MCKKLSCRIYSVGGEGISTRNQSQLFFGKMSKNNVFDVNVETLYLTREWRPKDEMMIGEEAQVVGTLPRKGNFPFGIFDTKIGFQTWEKKSINVALVETTRIMHRTREEPQTHARRKNKKEKIQADMGRYCVPLHGTICHLSSTSSSSICSGFGKFSLLNSQFSLTFSAPGCDWGHSNSLTQYKDFKTWSVTDLLPKNFVNCSSFI